jgi:hypothetical protein
MLKKLVLPSKLPSRKILALDIGGTLAKTALYVPKDDPVRLNTSTFEAITNKSIPCKLAVH